MAALVSWAWVACVCVVLGSVEEVWAEAQPGQLYSSLERMEALFTFDQLVGDLVMRLPEHLAAATSYLQSYMSVVVDRAQGMEVTGNPLHVYTVIKRLVLHWPHLRLALLAYVDMGKKACENTHSHCNSWALTNECLANRPFMVLRCPRACNICLSPEVVRGAGEVSARAADTVLPDDDDLHGAAFALARLQKIYLIPIGSFMAGTLAGHASAVRLTVEDCVRVANATHKEGVYSHAIIWFRYCYILAVDDSTTRELLRDSIRHVEVEHNTNWRQGDLNFFRQPLGPENIRQVPLDSSFAMVCRGEHKVVPEGWRLRCHVSDRGSAWLRLRPVRYEQLHHDPQLYIFYDIISDAEIALIQNLSKALLSRSTISDKNVNVQTTHQAEVRTSHTAWLYNTTHPLLERLATRISHVTGLHVFEGLEDNMAGEALQVLNYGIGGHYSDHLDVLFKHNAEDELSDCLPVVNKGCNRLKFIPGDRVATWMFYLSDVTKGGHTGFPAADISVPPVRGAAAFWYNLRADGEVNQNSLHGGCPVLLGHKWVANKWVRENVNFLRRPCPAIRDSNCS